MLGDKRLPQTTAASSLLIGIMHLRKRCHSQRDRTRLADIATASPEDSVAGVLPRLTDCADRRALVAAVAPRAARRNRRFDEQVIVAIFALAALCQLGWKELVCAFRDLIAWDNARLADLEKELRRQRKAKVGQRTAG